jgi:hypothetical protein
MPYSPLINVPRTNKIQPKPINQIAKLDKEGLNEKIIPSTPRITAIHQVITLGMLSLIIFSFII